MTQVHCIKVIKNILLLLKFVFLNIRRFFIKSRIKLAKRNWFISKNRNFYNPILEATVYKYDSAWSIARYGCYFGAFERKEDAMDKAFQIWLQEKRFAEIANELEHELKNLKHKILNEYKYLILDQQLKEAAQQACESDVIKALNPKRIMIFGRPGSGKSTFAVRLSHSLNLPLHHLDKYFYVENWVERDYSKFLQIQQDLVNSDAWIVDGNSTRSLEMRFSKADLVLYFNFPKIICYWRILKRLLKPNISFDDRAPGCHETIRWSLIKYMWSFEERVAKDVKSFKKQYPQAVFKEIRNNDDLNQLKNELVGKL